MSIKEQLNEYVEMYHNFGIWIPERRLYLQQGGEDDSRELDHKSSSQLIKNVHILESMSSDPVTVVINSPGGYEVDGYAIYDVIANSGCHMTGIVTGEASSAASIVLMAFDVRKAYKNSIFLIHDGSDEISGPLRNIERQAEATKLSRLKYYKLLEKHTNQDSKYWSRKLAHDYILTAEQALAEGLIHEIV